MGKAGYLPDISSRFAFWTEYAINCLQRRDWNGAASGLYNINSLLDEDYVVSISTKDYEQAVEDHTTYQCNHCKEDTLYSQVKIFDLVAPMLEATISGNKTNKVWICSKCGTDNRLDKTDVIQEETVQPFYRKVVPACPVNSSGLSTRLGWNNKFANWFFMFLQELQHSLALYRIEYISQSGHDMEDVGYLDKGDSR